MQTLPIHTVLPQIISTLRRSNRLILQAPPGAGKTTVVPLALLEQEWLGKKRLIILEPRRLAARNAAARMAATLQEAVGERVGYQIKGDRNISKKTQIVVVTEGILTRMLQSDPALEDVALIIFDEFHERHLHGDLALALSLQSQSLLRDDLKILVMSATLDTQALVTLLDGAPCISSKGRAFAVKEHYLEPAVTQPRPQEIVPLVVKSVITALKEERGSILVFLPGIKEITAVASRLQEQIDPKTTLLSPLYGDMSKRAQDLAIRPTKGTQRKIVLATNIAESSLTIEGVSVVIDSGLQRVSSFDSGSGMDRLETTFISQDSATQRSGRAGRQSEGVCYRLWHRHKVLMPHSRPEILSSDLTPMALELAAWGVDTPDELQWLDLPPGKAIDHAQALLERLGALRHKRITPHGEMILKIGTHPRLAHMMLRGADLGHTREVTLLAALLGEKDIFYAEARRSSDIRERLDTLLSAYSSGTLDKSALQRVKESARDFTQRLPARRTPHPLDEPGLLLAYAYPDRIAKIRAKNDTRYLLTNGKGARLSPEDPLFDSPYLVITDLDSKERDARIYKAVPIEESTLYQHFSEQITTETITRWNSTMQRVEARQVTRLGTVVLKEQHAHEIDEESMATVLLSAIKEEGLELLSWTKEARQLSERVTFLNFHRELRPGLQKRIPPLPDLSQEALDRELDRWLRPHLIGLKSFKALQKLDLKSILTAQLTWEQQKSLDALAPSRFRVPSGSQVFLDYHDPAAPTLSVRLQELFGLTETPALIDGAIPLTIELLSPARRPMQVTKDLKSFWDNTYEEVKKELRGKYKKHYWPDDPYEAVATSKTRKQMQKDD